MKKYEISKSEKTVGFVLLFVSTGVITLAMVFVANLLINLF